MEIQPSPFDTEILGLRVGKLLVHGLTPPLLKTIRGVLAASELDLVLVRDTGFAFEQVHELSWPGLQLADVKLTLSQPCAAGAAPRPGDFEVTSEVGAGDAKALLPLLEPIALRSRFAHGFGEAAARRLYERWLANCLNGTAADRCFVARRPGDPEPAGLVTVKKDGASGELTLVATAASFRGQGVLRLLHGHASAYLTSQGVARCAIATQLANRDALRAYEALGFTVDGMVVDFHLRRL